MQQVLAGGMLRLVHEHEVRRTANLDQSAVERPHARGVAGGEADRLLGRKIAQRREHRHHARDAQGLDTGARRRVGAEDDAVKLAHLARGAECVEGRALIAVVHDLEAALATLADAADLAVRECRVPAVDVAHDVGVGFQHHVLVDEARTGDRRATGVDRALDAILPRPGHHALRRRAVLDAAEAHLAKELHARIGQVLEILLRHFGLDAGCPGMDLDARRTEIGELPLRRDGECLEAHDVTRAARRVHLACRNHGGDAAIEVRIDPAQLVLAGRPVPRHRVDMAVDQAGGECRAIGIDDERGMVLIHVLRTPDRRDASILRHHGIRLDDGALQRAGEDQPDVPDDQFLGAGGRSLSVMRHDVLLQARCFSGSLAAHTATAEPDCRGQPREDRA